MVFIVSLSRVAVGDISGQESKSQSTHIVFSAYQIRNILETSSLLSIAINCHWLLA
jgi:hypothetical protein